MPCQFLDSAPEASLETHPGNWYENVQMNTLANGIKLHFFNSEIASLNGYNLKSWQLSFANVPKL